MAKKGKIWRGLLCPDCKEQVAARKGQGGHFYCPNPDCGCQLTRALKFRSVVGKNGEAEVPIYAPIV